MKFDNKKFRQLWQDLQTEEKCDDVKKSCYNKNINDLNAVASFGIAHHKIGYIKQSQNKDCIAEWYFWMAENCYNKCCQLQANLIDILAACADANRCMGNYDKANEHIKNVKDIDPNYFNDLDAIINRTDEKIKSYIAETIHPKVPK